MREEDITSMWGRGVVRVWGGGEREDVCVCVEKSDGSREDSFMRNWEGRWHGVQWWGKVRGCISRGGV